MVRTSTTEKLHKMGFFSDNADERARALALLGVVEQPPQPERQQQYQQQPQQQPQQFDLLTHQAQVPTLVPAEAAWAVAPSAARGAMRAASPAASPAAARAAVPAASPAAQTAAARPAPLVAASAGLPVSAPVAALAVAATPRMFTQGELEVMTDRFSAALRLGAGGFGEVFRGTLTSGTKVAVKRLLQSEEIARLYGTTSRAQFDAEIKVLAHFQHPCLVQLIGSCPDEPLCLVYQLMEGGSLAQRLTGGLPFYLRQRVVVSVQVAQGLAYLHLEVQRVHRDIKPDNILLDSSGNARIGDFGLARSVPESRQGTRTSGVAKGTFGYMAPEYATGVKVTTAVDVFSFGVVMLELLSGVLSPSPEGPIYSRHEELIADLQDGNDPDLGALASFIPEVLRAESEDLCYDWARLAAQCVEPSARRRPLIKTVLDRLEALLTRLPLEEHTCCVCLVNLPSVVLVPCGHQCLCVPCSAQLTSDHCPICRQQVSQRVVARLT